MSVKIINATPHPLVIQSAKGELVTLPVSGIVPRVSTTEALTEVVAGFEVYETSFGEVVGLPDEVAGVFYIVGAMVRSALPQRRDLLIPRKQQRDPEGKVTHALGLTR